MRAVIRFLYHEGVKPFEIYSRMKAKIQNRHTNLDDAPRPGAPVKLGDDATTWAIDKMIQSDRNISIRIISAELNLSYGSVQKFISKHLKYRKICTRWMPRLLTKEMKEKRLNACKELLERYEIEDKGFLDRIVTGDESWIHHHIPDS
ncbi:hypothetical protein LAZ67_1000475 [Cordylochernes scorpioides]|uniref:Uncharacterized protein n=1 Tax=Cordylochernes scorpioides TaxID=51811 RepID=A0ABY6JUQ5_9ARAC|nr:hypothetical protein LAZ67_1000475 [Cordylochernes scorpioides]